MQRAEDQNAAGGCVGHELATAPGKKAGCRRHGSVQKAWECTDVAVCGNRYVLARLRRDKGNLLTAEKQVLMRCMASGCCCHIKGVCCYTLGTKRHAADGMTCRALFCIWDTMECNK